MKRKKTLRDRLRQRSVKLSVERLEERHLLSVAGFEPMLPSTPQTGSLAPSNALTVVDTSVSDWRSLVKGIGGATEIVLIDLQEDGVQQVTEALRSRSNLDAVHIISHGSAGSLRLGNSILDLGTLANYSADLAV